MKAFGVIAIWVGLTFGAGCIDAGAPEVAESAQAVAIGCESPDDPACSPVDAGIVVTDPGDGLDELVPDCPIEVVVEEDLAAGTNAGDGCTHEQWSACRREQDFFIRAACSLACVADEGVSRACKGTPSRYGCGPWPKIWKAACKVLGY